MCITVTTQAELDAVVGSDEIIIEGDGRFAVEIRGTSPPNIRVFGGSTPIIWTFSTSKPSIGNGRRDSADGGIPNE